ncbi:NSFL1 cofactor p47 [Diaphorina citri]|uniref:NSFL1 cofactor p47 n=1 Tax=Diaphorina citri TaxID=121845 RepID=A0A3Q0JDP3_DIACI|nr:NSFL1 cofactor p47 [Diaphorina citri]
MSDQQNLISQFIEITGVEETRAKFYLESSGWDLNLATASFFEGDADGGTGSVESPPQSDNDEQDTPPPAIHFHGPGSSKPKSKSKEKSKASKPKFGTIASLKQQEEEEDDSDDEEGQAFYAGGSLHSGQQVIGPSKFFESTPVVTPVSGPCHLIRTTWATTPKDGLSLYELSQALISLQISQARSPGVISIVLSIISTPVVTPVSGPCHLIRTTWILVFLDLRSQQGKSLKPGLLAHPVVAMSLIRFLNISSCFFTGTFNHTHTIADVRSYINAARPQYETADYALQTTFPSKELADATQTIKDAGILNSAIVQRLR